MRLSDPGVVFPILLALVGAWLARQWPSRRDVAEAGLNDAKTLDVVIENLREEVEWVRRERESDREMHQRELRDLRRQHVREVDGLRTQVLELKRDVARLRQSR